MPFIFLCIHIYKVCKSLCVWVLWPPNIYSTFLLRCMRTLLKKTRYMEKTFFQQMDGNLSLSTCKIVNLDTDHLLYRKSNWKWIIDLTIKHKAQKYLENISKPRWSYICILFYLAWFKKWSRKEKFWIKPS